MMTSVDLARIAGVSQSTISRSLNDSPLVAEKTKEKIKKLAKEYNFEFNASAQNFKSGNSGCIGYVFPSGFEGFLSQSMQGIMFSKIHEAFAEHDLDVLPIYEVNKDETMPVLQRAIRRQRVDGLIVARNQMPNNIQNMLKAHKIPSIYIHDAAGNSEYINSISSDFVYACKQIAILFLERGYTDIFTILGNMNYETTLQKHKGFTQILNAAGIELTKDDIFIGDYTRDSGYKVTMDNLWRFRSGSAVFVQNDSMAIGVMAALNEKNIKVPEDVAVFGYDNNPLGTWFTPKLSTFSVNFNEIISRCVTSMLKLLDDPESMIAKEVKEPIKGEIILRQSFI